MRRDDYEDEIERIRARSNRRKAQKKQPEIFTQRSTREYSDDDYYYDRDDDSEYYDYDDSEYDQELDVLDFNRNDDHNYDDHYDNGSSTGYRHRSDQNEYRKRVPDPGQTKRAEKNASAKSSAKSKMPVKKKKKFPLFKLMLLAILILAGLWIYRSRQERGIWTVAVFGVDSRDGSLGKGALSDVEMIAKIDRATGEITLISVFRDTYLEIDSNGTYHKINEAYFKGGPEQAITALERNLDLKIDDYATFNWKSVADTINLLGGIDLEITDAEFAYINSFITETSESTGIPALHLTQSGSNHLDGVQAVAYARLRLMDTDFNRTQRQRKVLSLVMEKAKQADLKQLTNAAAMVIPQISTSVDLADVVSMAGDVSKYHIGETSGFPFSHSEVNIGKMNCVVPTTLESNVIQLHALLYGDTAYTPSSTVTQISAKIAADSGLGEVGKDVESGRDTSGSSGGSSGGATGGGQATQPQQAPSETAPPESLPEESSENETEESTGESTEETTDETADESTEETIEDSDKEEETNASVGPGGQLSPAETTEEHTQKPSSEEPASGGPGQTLAPETEDEPRTPAPSPVTPQPGADGSDSEAATPGD